MRDPDVGPRAPPAFPSRAVARPDGSLQDERMSWTWPFHSSAALATIGSRSGMPPTAAGIFARGAATQLLAVVGAESAPVAVAVEAEAGGATTAPAEAETETVAGAAPSASAGEGQRDADAGCEPASSCRRQPWSWAWARAAARVRSRTAARASDACQPRGASPR